MTKKSKENPEKKDDPEQSRRFFETAKELGSDESGKSFEKLFNQAAHHELSNDQTVEKNDHK